MISAMALMITGVTMVIARIAVVSEEITVMIAGWTMMMAGLTVMMRRISVINAGVLVIIRRGDSDVCSDAITDCRGISDDYRGDTIIAGGTVMITWIAVIIT